MRARRLLSLFLAAALVAWLPGFARAADGKSEERLAEARRLARAGKHRQAVAAFRSANRKAGGKCAECLVGLSSALLADGHLDEAIEAAQDALGLTSDSSLLALAYHHIGVAHYHRALRGQRPQTELAKAEEALRKAIAQGQPEVGTHLHLAEVLMEAGRGREAASHLESVLAAGLEGDAAARVEGVLQGVRMALAPLSAITLTTLDGKEVRMRDLAGKVVLLDFWATWCAPCVKSVPGLKNLQKRLEDERFVLVSIGVDKERGKLDEFVQRNKMDWTQAWDGSGAFQVAFGVRAVPTYLLVDHQGKIVLRTSGWSRDVESHIGREVAKMVKGARKAGEAPGS